MKKILLFASVLSLLGCLTTETRNPMRRPAGASSAAVVSSQTSSAPTPAPARQSDEEFFQENSFRWPDDRQPRQPEPAPAPAPKGDLY